MGDFPAGVETGYAGGEKQSNSGESAARGIQGEGAASRTGYTKRGGTGGTAPAIVYGGKLGGDDGGTTGSFTGVGTTLPAENAKSAAAGNCVFFTIRETVCLSTSAGESANGDGSNAAKGVPLGGTLGAAMSPVGRAGNKGSVSSVGARTFRAGSQAAAKDSDGTGAVWGTKRSKDLKTHAAQIGYSVYFES